MAQAFVTEHLGRQRKKERKREREKDRKLVITMASYALQCHLEWCTQSRLGQKTRESLKRSAHTLCSHNELENVMNHLTEVALDSFV